ncbi:MAG: HIT domain-containing protein [Candidatus Aenigmarchaeota archaeon]|nr:HIT domain-containing protein [Candidatus Aenigmarchaeota archaeon]
MEEKCVFCAIVKNQMPSFKVHEDDNFIVFLDIRPLNKGHALIVPKKHYRWTYDVEAFGPYWEIAKRIALAQIKGLDAKFVQFLTAGLGVTHAHIHVVPRYDNDGHGEYLDPSGVKQMSEQELKRVAETIKNSLPTEQPKVEEKMEGPVKKEREWTEEELELIRRELQQT